jgi:hypothetical protein
MHFHLPSTDAVLLTVARSTQRHANMRQFFAEHCYENVEWIFGRPTQNHHVGAREMAIETLRKIRCPILWLEDDATPTEHYTEDIDVPDDAQVAYLGGGRLGRGQRVRQILRAIPGACVSDIKECFREASRPPDRRSLYRDTADPEWIRIVTMFTGHAILWLDDQVRLDMANIIASSSNCYDIAWATHQWRYRIYGRRHPLFYQDDGHHAHTVTYCPEAS